MNRPETLSGKSWRTMPRTMFFRMFPLTLISTVTWALADIADALAVGNQVGETGLAVIGLTTPVYLVYETLGIGFASGGGITHTRLTAAEHRDRALAHFRFLSCLLLGIGFLIAALGNLFLEPLLTGIGAGKEFPALRAMCAGYLRPLISAAPLFFLNHLLYYFVRSDDHPALASTGFSIGCILDLGLNILLVIILKKGVRGSILATIAAQAVSAAIMSVHLFSSGKGILRLKALVSARADKKNVRTAARMSIRTGFSSAMSYFFQFLFLLLGNHLLIAAGGRGRIDGALAVAVFDLVINCSYVTASVYRSAGETMQPLAATFAVEHDEQSRRYLLKLAVCTGLLPGMLLNGILALLAGPIAGLFGLTDAAGQAMAVPALRLFLLSTIPAGLMMIFIAYAQSIDQLRSAAIGTFLRNAVFLLTFTLILGLFLPEYFWWVFSLTEGLSLLVTILAHTVFVRRRSEKKIPVISCTMTNDDHELGTVIARLEQFCAAHEVPAGTAVQLQLAVEELCAVTMRQAFSGKPGEYIRITLAVEDGPRYLLHIRNSAPYFNPLDMKMERVRKDMESEIMDSIGVMMIREKASSISFRNYQGYNVVTVEY